jgi:hypothetical protein
MKTQSKGISIRFPLPATTTEQAMVSAGGYIDHTLRTVLIEKAAVEDCR